MVWQLNPRPPPLPLADMQTALSRATLATRPVARQAQRPAQRKAQAAPRRTVRSGAPSQTLWIERGAPRAGATLARGEPDYCQRQLRPASPRFARWGRPCSM